ncbi:MAG TPA: autotransporter domain-containing protein, partial [Candidatus Methylacidiphilales bacterium]
MNPGVRNWGSRLRSAAVATLCLAPWLARADQIIDGGATYAVGASPSADTANLNLAGTSLQVGNTGAGTFTLGAGGTFTNANVYLGYTAGGTGTVSVSGGTWTSTTVIGVGYHGTGSLSLSGGTISDSVVYIGEAAGAVGTVAVSGGTWTNSLGINVGYAGTGTLTITGGAVRGVAAWLAFDAGGVGTASISGGTWSTSNGSDFSVGRAGTGTLTVSDSGVVSVSSGAGTVQIGELAGSTGTLNIGAGAGSAAAAPGTIQAGSVSFGAGTGALVFNHSSTGYTFTPVISGNGTVSVLSGTTVLTAADTYSGATTVSGGTLQIDGSLSSSAVTVNGGASDKIAASGAVTLGGTLQLISSTGLLGGDTVSLIEAGTLNGSFASVTNGLNNAVSFSVSTAANTVTVTAVQGSFAAFATNPNEGAVAQNLNKMASDPRATELIRALNALPGTALPAAFQQISPVQQAMTASTSLSVSRAATGTLQSRMDNIRAGSTGLSIDQVNLIDSDLPASALLAGTDMSVGQGVKILAPDPKNRWGFFLATDGNFGDVDGQTTQSNYHGVGITAGTDYRLDRAFTVGFAAGYDWSKTDFSNSGSNGEANSVRFGPYATWKDTSGDWLDMSAGGAHHWYDSNRDGFGGMATSSTTGLEFDSGVKYGHDFKIDEWTLTPTFGLDYMRLMIDGYTESGSLAPLAIQDQTVDSFRTNLGGTVGYTITCDGVRWTPYLSLGWAHELLDASSAVNARFASGAGDVFATQGDPLGHDSATFGTGIRGAFTDSLSAV